VPGTPASAGDQPAARRVEVRRVAPARNSLDSEAGPL